MGYTHYWTQTRDFKAMEWADICADVKTILDLAASEGIALANGHGEEGTAPELTKSHIAFNGVGDASHETMWIDRKRPPKEPWHSRRGWGFCKTARKPYDPVVTAVLCYLSTIIGSFDVTSDGKGVNFLAGLALARRALPRYANQLDIPMGVMEDDRWSTAVGVPYVSHFQDRYALRFCVDGFAYILGDGKSYRFPSHDAARDWLEPHKAIMAPSGYFDEARRQSLAKAQTAILSAKLARAAEEGAIGEPPAYVRPNEMAEAA